MKKFVSFAAAAAALLLLSPAAPAQDRMPVPAGPRVGLVEIASGLTAPVALVPSPDDTGRLFIVDQIGLLRVWTPESGLLEAPFLDVSAKLVELFEQYGFTRGRQVGKHAWILSREIAPA